GEWIRWQFGPKLDDALRAIKTHFDPLGLFAPGRIVDPPKMDDPSLFRYTPGYKTIALQPVFDWSAWNVQNDPATETTSAPGSGGDTTGGFAKAVEMCNNNGHCRKFDAGTMCPSYRVTRDEQHLTRGRANTLRLALSGQLGDLGDADPLARDAVAAALDLCGGCQGCKRDCPTGVDMAKMKLEATARRKARRGYTLRDRLIASLPEQARWWRRMPWLPNLRDRIPGAAGLTEKWLGLSARRSLPRWRADTFWHVAPTLGLATRDAVLAAPKAAVLFVDTFNGNFETENAVAAVRVLQAAGYAVHAAERAGGALCCGRTYLAAGMPERAKAKARELLDALLPFAERGIAIVGLEPSCLLTMRDEMQVMNLGAVAAVLAGQALLFEEFVVREARAGRFAPAFKPANRPLLVHGHCHQKAFGAMPPVFEALRLIPGADPVAIESSCCGMAGSFGYEAEHHEISMQMAELSLLPAIRRAPQATIVADGTSCRHQIADGAGREAHHVAQVLADHLA
ncbi:MAG: (Fe-S)-binding protein, partial [Caldimonas sp.]